MRTTAIFLLTFVFSFNVAWAQDGEAPLPNRATAREQETAPVGRFEPSNNSEFRIPNSELKSSPESESGSALPTVAPLPSFNSRNSEQAPNSQTTAFSLSSLLSPDGVMGSMGTLLALGALTLAPALIVMTTSFVRIVVVLGLLRQALGVQNLPPQQVITGLALFITFFVMYPVGNAIYNDALKPYEDGQITAMQAWDTGVAPLRQFMSRQIQKAGNDADVWLFWRADPDAPTGTAAENLTYDDVPLRVLIPAFMTSELKIAFLLGVKLFIPFLIIDFLVSSITVSMGIMTLPPVMISLPLKLLLFVMLDGWRLTVEMLLTSFG